MARIDGKEAACSAGDLGLIPGWGRSPGGGNGTPLQRSGLENPMDGGALRATVHGVAKSQTRLSDFTLCFHNQLVRALEEGADDEMNMVFVHQPPC